MKNTTKPFKSKLLPQAEKLDTQFAEPAALVYVISISVNLLPPTNTTFHQNLLPPATKLTGNWSQESELPLTLESS